MKRPVLAGAGHAHALVLRALVRQPLFDADPAAFAEVQRADVGSSRVGLVHGDATSLSGWGFAQEQLRDAGQRAEVARWLDRAEVDAFACTHTCLPVFQAVPAPSGRRARWILDNGAAGMPNFRGDTAGQLTRIAVEPFAGPEERFGVAIGNDVMAEAIAIDNDAHAWRARFQAQWPPGSDAHASYFDRIVRGPAYDPADAVRHLESPIRRTAASSSVTDLNGDLNQALFWYRNEPLSVFGYKTAERLDSQGRTDDLLRYGAAIEAGAAA